MPQRECAPPSGAECKPRERVRDSGLGVWRLDFGPLTRGLGSPVPAALALAGPALDLGLVLSLDSGRSTLDCFRRPTPTSCRLCQRPPLALRSVLLSTRRVVRPLTRTPT